MKIVFASNNPGKIKELNHLLHSFQLEIVPQSDLSVEEIPETGSTFEENALIKARHASHVTGLPAIADDSGLEVSALHGEPGIYSARYAGEKAVASDNIQKLLRELKHEKNRSANFHCVLVFVENAEDPNPIICHGIWSGEILTEARGKGGFGYDPIFFDPFQNCSAAELSLEIKNRISHRGKALQLLMKKMAEKQMR